jgi:hypothetical protein
MKTRLLIAVGGAALLLSTASAIAAPASDEAPANAALLVAICQDGTEWIGVAPLEASVLLDGSPLAMLDAASSGLPSGCDGFVLVSRPR